MKNKILVALLALLAINFTAIADTLWLNETPFELKVFYGWDGLTYWDGKPHTGLDVDPENAYEGNGRARFDGWSRAVYDNKIWGYRIPPCSEMKIEGDLLYDKKQNIVYANLGDGIWKKVIDKSVGEGGNRKVTVFINAGNKFDLTTALMIPSDFGNRKSHQANGLPADSCPKKQATKPKSNWE